MDLCNTLIYAGRLQCGSEEVATATLDVPQWDLASREIRSDWLKETIDPVHSVCFINTDKVNMHVVHSTCIPDNV